MSRIERHGVTPRWSDKVVHHLGDNGAGTVYLVEVATTPAAPFGQQVQEIFASIERQLAEVGSGVSQLLQVTIYLTDMANLAAFNAAWDAWIPSGCAPSRACLRADLVSPEYLVELVVVAAVCKKID